MELKGPGSPVEPKVGGAKMGRDEAKCSEAGGRDAGSLTQALLVVAQPEARSHNKASPEMAKGCKHPAQAGIEDWLSSAVMVADANLTRSMVVIYSPCRSIETVK